MSKYRLILAGILIALIAGSFLIYFLTLDGSPLVNDEGYIIGERYVEPRHITGAAVITIIGLALIVGGALWPEERTTNTTNVPRMASSPPNLVCESCGSFIEAEWVACPRCGARLR